jgi:uncharacterized membrane protein HdeD (DUF308 family)
MVIDFEPGDESAIHKHRVPLLIEGIVLVVLGATAILVPAFATVAARALIGYAFLISGLVGIATTFWMGDAPGFWWSQLSAYLRIIAGILLLEWLPHIGVLSLILVLAAFFIIEGVASIKYALEHRDQRTGRWDWMLLSGIVDLSLAAIVVSGMAAWVPGFLVGINMLCGGTALIGIALAARKPA